MNNPSIKQLSLHLNQNSIQSQSPICLSHYKEIIKRNCKQIIRQSSKQRNEEYQINPIRMQRIHSKKSIYILNTTESDVSAKDYRKSLSYRSNNSSKQQERKKIQIEPLPFSEEISGTKIQSDNENENYQLNQIRNKLISRAKIETNEEKLNSSIQEKQIVKNNSDKNTIKSLRNINKSGKLYNQDCQSNFLKVLISKSASKGNYLKFKETLYKGYTRFEIKPKPIFWKKGNIRYLNNIDETLYSGHPIEQLLNMKTNQKPSIDCQYYVNSFNV